MSAFYHYGLAMFNDLLIRNIISRIESFLSQTKHYLRKNNNIPKEPFHFFLKEREFKLDFKNPNEHVNTFKK